MLKLGAVACSSFPTQISLGVDLDLVVGVTLMLAPAAMVTKMDKADKLAR